MNKEIKPELFIVATPIGNLDDISFRAKKILENVDLIACEDTRHSGILLKHYEIKKPLISFHSHSKENKVEKIIKYLLKGEKIALISDAGTPGISDPGYVLIKKAIQNNIKITPIPGSSAFITALSASGLATDKFVYLGFLPVKKGRQTIFKQIAESKYTTVFYESPHRLLKTIKDLKTYIKEDSKIVIAKELTKIYETFIRSDIKNIDNELEKIKIKGEFVIMISNS